MFLRAALRVYPSKSTFHRSFGRHPAGSRCNVEFLASRRRFGDLLPNTCRPIAEGAVKHLVPSPFKDVELPNVGICEIVWKRVEEWPDKTAIVCGLTGRSYQHGQLRESCRKFGSALRKAGLAQGDVVAVVLYNSPDYPVVVLGAIEAGLVVTTVNPDYMPGEISKQFQDINPRLVVTSSDRYENVVKATNEAVEKGYKAPLIVVTDGEEGKNVPKGALDMHQIINSNDDVTNISNVKINLEAPALVLYSSGTTGLPKGVLLSQRNLVAAMQIHQEPSIALMEPATGAYQDSLPAVLPFFHVYGIVVILMVSISFGCKVVTMAPKFDPKLFMEVLQKHKASLLFLAPPVVLFLGSAPGYTLEHITSLRYVLSGAAPLREEDAQRFLKRAPPNIKFLQGYGLTEASPVVCWNRKDSTKVASVGPCVPNTVLKVIDHNGYTLGPFEKGQICVKGPQVMIGYHNNSEATRRDKDEAGWLHTGDIGYYDTDLDFFIVDRLKELIKVKGYQVAPAELEELLRTHPEVEDCAVVGVPDDRSGETVYAFVTPKSMSNASHKLKEELMHFVNNKVIEYKQIKEVEFIDIIPKSSAGKILRRVLREKLLQKEEHDSESE